MSKNASFEYDQIHGFFQLLVPDLDSAMMTESKIGLISIYKGNVRCHRWFRPVPDEIEELIKYLKSDPDFLDLDWYYTVNGHDPDSAGSRGKNISARTMYSLYADIDFNTKPDAKKRYPSPAETHAMLESHPRQPSIIVHTGGGLHVYWVFSAPLDAQENKLLPKLWQDDLRRRLGCEMDSTADLARILRLPGTWNHKHGRPVQIIGLDEIA